LANNSGDKVVTGIVLAVFLGLLGVAAGLMYFGVAKRLAFYGSLWDYIVGNPMQVAVMTALCGCIIVMGNEIRRDI
jgi:hypothetical protein